jgi:hypothetical protein
MSNEKLTGMTMGREHLRPGDRFAINLGPPRWTLSDDGESAYLDSDHLNSCERDEFPVTVYNVVRSIPSTPPAPVRKGRVGMRLKGNETGRIVTLTDGVACAGLWAAYLDGITVVYVDDESIGSLWTVLPDAPADARAEAVQLRRRDLSPGDRFRYVDGETVSNPTDADFAPWFVDAAGGDNSKHGPRGREIGWNGREGDSLVENVQRGAMPLTSSGPSNAAAIRFTAAPVATPEVVRTAPKPPVPRCTSEFLADYEQRQREAPHDHRPIPRATREMWSAAVTLRLAARAEERRLREQQHCQPNWAGGDDVDE